MHLRSDFFCLFMLITALIYILITFFVLLIKIVIYTAEDWSCLVYFLFKWHLFFIPTRSLNISTISSSTRFLKTCLFFFAWILFSNAPIKIWDDKSFALPRFLNFNYIFNLFTSLYRSNQRVIHTFVSNYKFSFWTFKII